jgi:hypothetical protein
MAETPTFAVGESVQVAKTPSVSYWYIGPRQAKHRADSFGTVVARPCDISGDYTCVQFNDHDDDGQSQPVAIPTCDLVRHRPPNLEELRELLKDVEWQDLDEEADDELDARDATIKRLRRVADMVCIVNQTGDGTASRPGTQYVGLVVGSTLRLLSNGRGNSLLSERDVQEVAEAVNQAKEV